MVFLLLRVAHSSNGNSKQENILQQTPSNSISYDSKDQI